MVDPRKGPIVIKGIEYEENTLVCKGCKRKTIIECDTPKIREAQMKAFQEKHAKCGAKKRKKK